jgi:GNAT superfamily N-acetyltransferase
MRDFINIVNESVYPILEGRVMDIPNEYGTQFRIYMNPSREQVVSLASRVELRGIILNDDAFVWSSFEATHDGAWLSLIGQGFEDGGKADFTVENTPIVDKPSDLADYETRVRTFRSSMVANHPVVQRWRLPLADRVNEGTVGKIYSDEGLAKRLPEADTKVFKTKDGRGIEMHNTGGEVTATVDGVEAGSLQIHNRADRDNTGKSLGSEWSVRRAWVEAPFRRQGIAKAMYDYAYYAGFRPLRRSRSQTEGGAALWADKRHEWAISETEERPEGSAFKLKDGRTVYLHHFVEPLEDAPIEDENGNTVEVDERTALVVYAESDGQTIGKLAFDLQLDFVRGVDVDEKYRRLGVATALYDHLEGVLGYETYPSNNLAPDGVKFWAAREKLQFNRAKARGRPLTEMKKWATLVESEAPRIVAEIHPTQGIAIIHDFHIPKVSRKQGLGRRAYEEWEASLPKEIKLVRLFAADYDNGNSDGFWEAMGFDWNYTGENLSYEAQHAMWKGVNGHPTPPPVNVDEEELDENCGDGCPAEQFEDAFYARYEASALYSNTRLSLRVIDEHTIDIVSIDAKTKNAGYGSALMRLICHFADEFDITLTLSVAEDADGNNGGLEYDSLMAWYERFGFQQSRRSDMVRPPEGAEPIFEGKGRSWVGTLGETDIYEISTQSELARLLKKHWYLRGFLFADRAYVWDGHGAVHPDAREYLSNYDYEAGQETFGVPVHLQGNRITIRHHSSTEEDVRGMYEQVMNSPVIKRLYRGGNPEVWGEDNDGSEERLDDKDWGETEPADWQQNWGVY